MYTDISADQKENSSYTIQTAVLKSAVNTCTSFSSKLLRVVELELTVPLDDELGVDVQRQVRDAQSLTTNINRLEQ